jgi:NADH dehydrogenase [ubiquinone] 1 alpha subcomplex assembly factor 5
MIPLARKLLRVRSAPLLRSIHSCKILQSPQIFNSTVKSIQRKVAITSSNYESYSYIRDEIAQRLLDRLSDIKRDFPVAVELGSYSNSFLKHWSGHGNIRTIHLVEPCKEALEKPIKLADPSLVENRDISIVKHNLELESTPLLFDDHSVDLVVSNLSLHWTNDLEFVFSEAKRVLKPDGVFLGSMFGGETLFELRSSFVVAEMNLYQGVSPHISPMIGMSDLGNLLQNTGFRIPTVDIDNFSCEYPNALVLMEHLQGMGENNASILAAKTGARRDLMLATAAVYQSMYGTFESSTPDADTKAAEAGDDAHIPATFEVLYWIGWSPDQASQPKSLPRGSVPSGFHSRTKK